MSSFLSRKQMTNHKRMDRSVSGFRRRMFFEPLEVRRVLASITLGTGGTGEWALDPGFAGGTVTKDVVVGGVDFAADVAVQADGKIVAAGEAFVANQDFAVVRYNADGTPDTTFGNGGVAIIPIGTGNDTARSVAIDSQGRIVVAGTAFVGGFHQIAVIRLNPNGSLDTSFDLDGIATANFVGDATLAEGMALQQDDKIVVVATLDERQNVGVARFNTNGTLDDTFNNPLQLPNNGGRAVVNMITDATEMFPSEEFAAGISIDGSQRIVIAAVGNDGVSNVVALARLTADGILDSSFGTGGITVTPSDGQITAIAADGDGSVVATGIYAGISTDDVFVSRYDASGVLDPNFGTSGVAVTELPEHQRAFDVAIQNGNIVVVGSSFVPGQHDELLVMRYTSSGDADLSFTANGRITTSVSNENDVARGVAIDGDGNIVVAGAKGDLPEFVLARYKQSAGGPPPAFTLDENGSITLEGSFTTTSGSATISINWGDDSPVTTLNVTGMGGTFAIPKQYLDDNPTGSAVDVNTIIASIQEGSSAAVSATTTATVSNLAPSFVSVISAAINENGFATISGSFTDIGTLDTHSILVNWGNGTTWATINAADRTFTATRQYLDDNPTGTAADVYSVSLTLTDDDTGSAAATTTVTVSNVAPSVNPIVGLTAAVRGQSVGFTGSFTDVGSLDTHQVFWDFGDGTTIAFHPSTDPGSLAPSHAYANAGTYTVTLKVRDDDTGETIVSRQQTIVIAQLEPAPCGCGTALVIGGTSSAEAIRISSVTGGVEVFINAASVGVFNPSHAIVVHAYAGNDDVQVAGSIALPAWIYGGDGDDRLKGGAGADMIQGQVGHDLLVGGAGRDLLIGGLGQDRIVGNSDDDILVSGTTDHDNNPAALCAILAEWNSNRWGYERVASIYGCGSGTRLNGNYYLNDNTVHDDGERDVLTGSSGFDWFFANLSLYNDDSPTKDKITDQNWWEFAKDIDFIEG